MRTLATLALVLLLTAFLFTTPAEGQDFATLINQAVQIGDEMILRINLGLEATDLASARVHAREAANAGERWQTVLAQALALAPDDAARSTVEANITHVNAAIVSANQAVTGPDSEVRSRLDAARGEANEALTELRPLAHALPPAPVAPPVLPRAGGLNGSLLILAGALAFIVGLGLRRSQMSSA